MAAEIHVDPCRDPAAGGELRCPRAQTCRAACKYDVGHIVESPLLAAAKRDLGTGFWSSALRRERRSYDTEESE